MLLQEQGIIITAALLLGLACVLAALFLFVAHRHGTARYFRDQAFHFQTLRALNYVRADGADTAEVLETIRLLSDNYLDRSCCLTWKCYQAGPLGRFCPSGNPR